MTNALSLQQQTRLQQKLNPQQVMFGRLLEMSAPEIEDEVRRALDENPALETVDHSLTDNTDSSDSGDFSETAEQLQLADYAGDDEIPPYHLPPSGRDSGDAIHFMTESLSDSTDTSLYESLSSQLSEHKLDPEIRTIALYIIGNLDDNGYLTRNLPEIADDIAIASGMEVTTDAVKRAFATVRELDPAGIGAVDLRDCLLLQIDRAPRSLTQRIAHEIIADWFDLFSKLHFDQLRSHLGVDSDEMQKALEFIRSLNPKPGSLLEQQSPEDRLRHIVPDFAVDIDSNRRITVSLLNNTPELAIEESFRAEDSPEVKPARSKRDNEARTFIKRRRDDAAAFISMLEMRSQTLMAVMRTIASIQRDFFLNDDDRSRIRPMIIKDIASATGLDISVISRASAGKYVLTAHGIYPLKMFFNERPKDDTDISSHEISEMLDRLIKSEDKHHPLSDEALCRALAAKGYDIARRTVTKYRERLGHPVARLRKHF